MSLSSGLGTPKRSNFWNRSPSPLGSHSTPKRRPKDETLLVPSKVSRKLDISKETTDSYEKFKSTVTTSLLGMINESEDQLVPKCIAKYGFNVFHTAMCACKHVPEQFPERHKYINNILQEVNAKTVIDDTEELIRVSCKLNLDIFSTDTEAFQNILWKLSKHGPDPYMNFYVPPVRSCIQDQCSGNVHPCSKSTITIYKMTGPEPGLKSSLRCKMCLTRYHIDMYSVPNVGKKLYTEKVNLKSASNMTYFSEDTYELLCESSNHAFVSHKAFSAIYNSVFNENHPRARHFYQWQKLYKLTDVQQSDRDNLAEDISDDNDDNILHGLSGKMALKCFFRNELQKELDERNLTSRVTFNKTNTQSSVICAMDKLRRDELYTHDCSESCRKKGCSNLRIIDGIWKLNMYTCMMAVPQNVKGYPLLSFPNMCVNQPSAGQVFCEDHCVLLKRHNIPLQKGEFLKLANCKEKDTTSQIEEKVMKLARTLIERDEARSGKSALSYQGTESIVSHVEPSFWDDSETKSKEYCNKDIGLKGKLRQRSRGHFVCVTGGGHIMYFNPLFKSESPSQIFVQTIKVIYEDVKQVPLNQLGSHLKNYFLAYDNMCHLDTLKAAKCDLPLPGPYKKLWMCIKKVIDTFHLPNHKNPVCKKMYNPSILPEGYNTQAAEQTFSWMGRFKKIVNSMTQEHHLFYLHRMIKRRNAYTARCRKQNIEPVLPQLKYVNSNKDD